MTSFQFEVLLISSAIILLLVASMVGLGKIVRSRYKLAGFFLTAAIFLSLLQRGVALFSLLTRGAVTVDALADAIGLLFSALLLAGTVYLERLIPGADSLPRDHADKDGEKDHLLKAISVITDGIAITDEKDRIIYLNNAHAGIYGYSHDELAGKTWRDIIAPEVVPLVEKNLSETLHNRDVGFWSGESPARRKDGTILPTEVTATARWGENGDYLGHICIVRDISRRKQAEENTQKTNQTLVALIRYSPLAIICTDMSTNVLLWNPAAEKIFGWKEEEVLGRKNPIIPEDKQEEYLKLRTDVQSGSPYISKELQRRRKDGTLIYLNAASASLHSTNGTVIALLGMFEDITERRRAYEELRDSEGRFRGAFENAAVGASMVDLKGRFIKVNRRLCEMLGYSEDELLARTYSDITHPDDIWKGMEAHSKQMSGETDRSTFEKRYIHKKGHLVNIIISPSLIRDDNGAPRYFVGLWQDITERRRAEEELRKHREHLEALVEKRTAEAMHAAHLASLGELAAGVAHEINNPINGIINYAEILVGKMEKSSREHDIAERIIKEGVRIADIVSSLLSFGRESKNERKPVKVLELLTETMSLIDVQLQKNGIRLDIKDAGCFEVIADPQQLQQVFMNLISNSRYALNQKYPGPHGDKRIEIRSEKVRVNEGQFVRIGLIDYGTGIPRDLIDKVTNPFFTTKSSGQGTGLGLSISRGIIENHGGSLKLESEEGKFTRVLIDLPLIGPEGPGRTTPSGPSGL